MWRLVTDGLDVLGCTVKAPERRVPRPVSSGHSILGWRAEAGQVTELYMMRLKCSRFDARNYPLLGKRERSADVLLLDQQMAF
jgi:hypothetical protein